MRSTYTIARNRARFFTDYEDQTPDLVIPDAEGVQALSDEELSALQTRAVEAFNALYGDGSGLTDEDLTALSDLEAGISVLRADDARRTAEAEERATRAAELAQRVAPAAEGDGDAGDGEDEGEGDDAGDGDEETPAEDEPVEEDPAEEAPPETPPAEDGGSDNTAEVEQPEAIAASSARKGPRKINLGRIGARAAARPADQPTGTESMGDIVVAAPDVPGFSNGQGLDWNGVGRAIDARLKNMNIKTYERAARDGKHIKQQYGAVVIQKPFDERLRIKSDDTDHIESVLAFATDESRLPGGSLVASGTGWCAPSMTIYDLCEMESRDGLFQVPEIDVTRGGINHTLGPDFGTIYAETGFEFTEEDDIDGDYDGEGGPKPCYHVPCPEFTDDRLDVAGLCLTAGLLQQKGYPEVIARTVRGALVAHDHKMAARKVAAIAAASTQVTMPADQVGAVAPLLTAIELQVEHYKEVRRLSRNQSVEIVLPFWVRGALRADLARRLGIDLLDVTDQRIDALIRSRGAAPQFIYNWQGVGSTPASGFTAYPTTVDFLLYAAGTWVAGGSDVITIDTLFDSTLLGTNDYTALFTEEGWLVAQRCHDSRRVTVAICPDGATHAGVSIDCDGSAGA